MGRGSERGLIARPASPGGTLSVDPAQPYFIIVGSSNGYQGQEIWKVGRVSGWRQGTVTQTCQEFFVTGLPGSYPRKVTCANISSAYNIDGDRGGPLFLPAGGPFVYVSGSTNGIPDNYPSFTNYSTISETQLDFANTLGVTRIATMTAPQLTGAIVGNAPSVSWGAVAGASTYHVFRQQSGGQFSYFSAVQGLSFADPSVTAIAVSSNLPPNGAPYAAYYVTGQSAGSISPSSNILYFQKPAAISVTMQGQFAVKPNVACVWTATPSGGSGSYTYQWRVNNQSAGTNSAQFQYSAAASYTLSVTVSDGISIPGYVQQGVTVSSSNPSCGF